MKQLPVTGIAALLDRLSVLRKESTGIEPTVFKQLAPDLDHVPAGRHRYLTTSASPHNRV